MMDGKVEKSRKGEEGTGGEEAEEGKGVVGYFSPIFDFEISYLTHF